MTFFVRLLQLIIVTVPVLTFAWLATQWLVPSGVFYVSHTPGQSSSFIDELKPNNRVGEPTTNSKGEWIQSIIADPAFFFVHPHRTFEKIDFEIWFQNKELPIVEIGALSAIDPERYTLKPIHNLLIEESDWSRLDERGKVLLQREVAYDSIDAFYARPPDRDLVATYRTDFDIPYRVSSYIPSDYWQTIDVSLRGHHEFKTYIKDENLKFVFEYQDMNRDEGPDTVQALVFNEDGFPVAEARASDDGNSSMDQIASGLERLELNVGGLEEGVYKVVLNTTRDVFFRKIHTPQQKIVFLNTVFIGDEVGYRAEPEGATLWTDAEYLSVQTRHAGGVQDAVIDGEILAIEEPYLWYEAILGSGVSSVDVPLGDVEVVLEGKIAFSESQFFNPDPVHLTAYSNLDDLGVDFVLAEYVSPRQEGDWQVATVSFSQDELFAEEDGTWKISFSTPAIDLFNTELIIHKINTWFYRELGDQEDFSSMFQEISL